MSQLRERRDFQAHLTAYIGWQFRDDASAAQIGAVSLGLLIAGISLLVTGRYPRGLYDLLHGIARWSLRVIAYVALLTDQYPPLRLDQGDDEPGSNPVGPAVSTMARPVRTHSRFTRNTISTYETSGERAVREDLY